MLACILHAHGHILSCDLVKADRHFAYKHYNAARICRTIAHDQANKIQIMQQQGRKL